MYAEKSEAYLVQQAIYYDDAAFAALYERYLSRVYRHVFYWVPDPADAEDITQEVFVKAWRAIGRYKITGAPFITWLIAIARNLITDHFRARKRLVPLNESVAATQDDKPGPESIAETALSQNDVRNAIAQLNGAKQRVIQMRFIEGSSYSDIARALNKSEGAVRVIQFRALSDLRKIMERSEGR